jgi:hypothetical protein
MLRSKRKVEEMQRTTSKVKRPPRVEEPSLSQRIKDISEKVKIIRFGIVYEPQESPWDRLAGMFAVSKPVDIEEILDARGFEE